MTPLPADPAEDLAPETLAAPHRFCPKAEPQPVSDIALVWLHPFRSEPVAVPAELTLRVGDTVVFRDATGEDIGQVVGPSDAEPSQTTVIRQANDADLVRAGENRQRAEDGLAVFRRLVQQFHLVMKPASAWLRLDRREICFYFVSEERLNFRALHKAVSSALDLRVSIRQVGVRDYARVLGGAGPCGRILCCSGFLSELAPITLRMARQQSLFVEPSKISGVCGKLLCCLGFEENTYRETMDRMPRVGSTVRVPAGLGRVTGIDVLGRKVIVLIENAEIAVNLDEVKRES